MSIFATLNRAQKARVITAVADQALLRLEAKVKALEDAFDFRELSAEEQLQRYNERPPEEWAWLEQNQPPNYKEQLQDYMRLSQRMFSGKPSAIHQVDFDQIA